MRLLYLITLVCQICEASPKFKYQEQVVIKNINKRLNISKEDDHFYNCKYLKFIVFKYEQQFFNNDLGCRYAYTIKKIDLRKCPTIPHTIIACEDSIKIIVDK